MKFVHPAFLFALFAIAIPIIIHLFNLRRFKKITFTNVRFLKEIQQETQSKAKLKHLLVLFARIFAIVFLVLAFAQPYISSQKTAITPGKMNVVSIYVDNSFSMDARTNEGSLLDNAARKTREILSAYQPNDRFQLLTNDFEGKHQRLVSKDELITLLEEVKISPISRSFSEIIARQEDLLGSEAGANKQFYWVSDFQKNPLNQNLLVDSGITIRAIVINAVKNTNVSIDSVWFNTPVRRVGVADEIVVKLVNHSDSEVDNVPLRLTINGEQKAISSANLKAKTVYLDTLVFTPTTLGWQTASIAITDFPITFDDNYFFTFKVEDKIPIHAIFADRENIFLNAIFKTDNFFDFRTNNENNVDYTALANAKLVILDAVKSISTGLAEELKKYLNQGGSIAIFPGQYIDLNSYKNFLSSIGTDYYENYNSTDERINNLNLEHEIFKDVFDNMPQNPDLPSVKNYFTLSIASRVIKEPIMQLRGNRPVLNQYNSGVGKVYLFSIPLDDNAGNFPRHALFVPVMYQLSLLSNKSFPLSYTIGSDAQLQTDISDIGAANTLRLKKGNFEIIPDFRNFAGQSKLFIADQLRDAGVYQLMQSDEQKSVFAFNFNRTESVLDYYTSAELQALLGDNSVSVLAPGSGSIVSAIAKQNFGTRLWKYCVIFALIFLAAEVLLLRYWDKLANRVKTT